MPGRASILPGPTAHTVNIIKGVYNMDEYETLKSLTGRIYNDLSNDMGIYFDEIQGREEEAINEIVNALLTGDTNILDYMEEGSDLYNDTISFMLFDRKRVVDKLIKGGK